tara:strand:+ start:209 stop:496 length:288 start_codon:yes stop_codon:yes gene_type:complete
MNKAKLKKIIKEEMRTVLSEKKKKVTRGLPTGLAPSISFLNEAGALSDIERIANEFEEIAALSASAMIKRRLGELIERLRQAVAAHREEMSQPGW